MAASEEMQRTTRDYDVMRADLQRWIAAQLTEGDEAEITSFDVPSKNGMSSETILFELAAGGKTLSCVARVVPDTSAVPVFPTYDLERQYRVMSLVASRTEVPVPPLRWIELDSAHIGAPFLVMDRVEGDIPPDVLPYNFGSWLFDASPDEQQRLQNSTIHAIARLHEMDAAPEDLAFLELGGSSPSPLRRHVDDQRAYYEWAAQEVRIPVLERCFAWLEDHWPRHESGPVLSWGDARIGNVIYRDFTPAALLDWEMAAVGPRELDIGWLIFLHCWFEDIAQSAGLPGMPHFLRPDAVTAAYEAITGHTPRDLEFYLMYAALRHGIVMTRVAHRRIHFGEAEMPSDPDDLVWHRAALEAILAGTYWQRW
jgi:aminoglycoside phosphotransferase (APT) family kinase protein